MSELITISIPTHRRPSVLLHALHSCFIQDYRPLEIDIGDDSPSPDSRTLVESLEPPQGISLRYWQNSPSLKQAANVNKLLRAARGSKLVLLHDDDALLPGAISAMHQAFDMSPSVIATYGLQQVLHENGELSPADAEAYNSCAFRTPELAGLQQDVLTSALWMQFPNNSYLIKTELARQVGYRSEQEVGDGCDSDFGVRLALANREAHYVLLNRYTSQYRLSSTGLHLVRNTWAGTVDRLLALQDLTPGQQQARDSTVRKVVVEAIVENVLKGRKRRALNLFLSPYYPRNKFSVKTAYHLGLIALPGLVQLRDRYRRPSTARAGLTRDRYRASSRIVRRSLTRMLCSEPSPILWT